MRRRLLGDPRVGQMRRRLLGDPRWEKRVGLRRMNTRGLRRIGGRVLGILRRRLLLLLLLLLLLILRRRRLLIMRRRRLIMRRRRLLLRLLLRRRLRVLRVVRMWLRLHRRGWLGLVAALGHLLWRLAIPVWLHALRMPGMRRVDRLLLHLIWLHVLRRLHLRLHLRLLHMWLRLIWRLLHLRMLVLCHLQPLQGMRGGRRCQHLAPRPQRLHRHQSALAESQVEVAVLKVIRRDGWEGGGEVERMGGSGVACEDDGRPGAFGCLVHHPVRAHAPRRLRCRPQPVRGRVEVRGSKGLRKEPCVRGVHAQAIARARRAKLPRRTVGDGAKQAHTGRPKADGTVSHKKDRKFSMDEEWVQMGADVAHGEARMGKGCG